MLYPSVAYDLINSKEMESEKCNPVLLQITLEYSNVIEDPELKISHIADYKTKEKTCDYHPQ